jgi:molybdate transport system regulatory protein
MRLSIRNQLAGTVKSVALGTVMAEVVVDVDGKEMTAEITRGGAENLELAEGNQVVVLIKSTDVMIGK